jgi:hypothetical protein
MEAYFKAGTVIEVPDWEALGATLTDQQTDRLPELDQNPLDEVKE